MYKVCTCRTADLSYHSLSYHLKYRPDPYILCTILNNLMILTNTCVLYYRFNYFKSILIKSELDTTRSNLIMYSYRVIIGAGKYT